MPFFYFDQNGYKFGRTFSDPWRHFWKTIYRKKYFFSWKWIDFPDEEFSPELSKLSFEEALGNINLLGKALPWCNEDFRLKKSGPCPASFSFIFGLFQKNNTIFTTNQCEKMSSPSSIRRRDSNPWPFESESPPLTTRPGLPPYEDFRLYPVLYKDAMNTRNREKYLRCMADLLFD